jgi:hypothetical protein
MAALAAFYGIALLEIALPARPQSSSQIQEIKMIHKLAIHEVGKENVSLDDPVSVEMRRRFEQTTGLKSKGGSMSWRELLKSTEDSLDGLGLIVKLEISSSPGTCSVQYVPIVGGATLDGGDTRATLSVAPKFYLVTCTCGTNILQQRVDATENRLLHFRCELKAHSE